METVVLIDKKDDITSYKAIETIKYCVDDVKKIGHIGTLDVCAKGLLIAPTNHATSLIPFLEKMDKTYKTTITFGISTTTLDAEGEILEQDSKENLRKIFQNNEHFEEKILPVILSFQKTYKQIPPAISSKKFEGKTLLQIAKKDFAKANELANKRAKNVTIYKISDIVPNIDQDTFEVSMTIHCSSGTYIRVIAQDIAKELGTFAHLKTLQRTQIGNVSLDDLYDILDKEQEEESKKEKDKNSNENYYTIKRELENKLEEHGKDNSSNSNLDEKELRKIQNNLQNLCPFVQVDEKVFLEKVYEKLVEHGNIQGKIILPVYRKKAFVSGLSTDFAMLKDKRAKEYLEYKDGSYFVYCKKENTNEVELIGIGKLKKGCLKKEYIIQ